jgi:hypothetical protein
MASIAATVFSDCGDFGTARQMFLHMLEESTDPRVVDDMRRKLRELQALEQITTLRAAVAAFKERTGQLPASLALVRPLAAGLPEGSRIVYGADGLPLDPNGVPYVYNSATGDVTSDPGSIRLPRGIVRKKAGD